MSAQAVRWCPALLCRVRDVDRLRHDFPVLLRQSGDAAEALRPLRTMVDELADRAEPQRRRDLLTLEGAMRRLVARDGPAPLSAHLANAGHLLLDSPGRGPDDRSRLDRLLAVARDGLSDGILTGCDTGAPLRFVSHLHGLHQAARGATVRAELDALAGVLARALAADDAERAAAWTPAGLQAAVSPWHATDFDFEVMARLLVAGRPRAAMPVARRERLAAALATLRQQDVFRPAPVLHDIRDAVSAWERRLDAVAALMGAARLARWHEMGGGDTEIAGPPATSARDAQALCPSVLVALDGDRLGHGDALLLLDALAAGLPLKVVVTTGEALALRPGVQPAAGGTWRGSLGALAMGLGTAWVVQTTAAHLPRLIAPLVAAMSSDGPALVFVYAPAADDGGLSTYLRAAAAAESRSFVPFVFDPASGKPALPAGAIAQPDDAWPTARFQYEDERLQTVTVDLAFTTADFLAADPRHADRFRLVPPGMWDTTDTPVAEWLALASTDQRARTPYVVAVDDDGRLQRLVPDEAILESTRRAAAAWQSARRRLMPAPGTGDGDTTAAPEATAAAPARAATPPAGDVGPDSVPPAVASGKSGPAPWVETHRCTSCNECIKANGRLFAYDDNRQAYIRDAAAGSYRDLVEAAERCALALIHPGAPRNPDEAGLEELERRAAPFR